MRDGCLQAYVPRLPDISGLDVTLVRVGYVLLTLFTAFSGVIAYFILVIVIPQEKNRYFK